MKRFIQEMYVKKQLLLYDHDRFCFLNNLLKWSKNYIGKWCYDDNIVSISVQFCFFAQSYQIGIIFKRANKYLH